MYKPKHLKAHSMGNPPRASHCCDNDHEVAVVSRAAQQVWSDTREESLGELAWRKDMQHVSRLEGGSEGGREIGRDVKLAKRLIATLQSCITKVCTVNVYQTPCIQSCMYIH